MYDIIRESTLALEKTQGQGQRKATIPILLLLYRNWVVPENMDLFFLFKSLAHFSPDQGGNHVSEF